MRPRRNGSRERHPGTVDTRETHVIREPTLSRLRKLFEARERANRELELTIEAYLAGSGLTRNYQIDLEAGVLIEQQLPEPDTIPAALAQTPAETA